MSGLILGIDPGYDRCGFAVLGKSGSGFTTAEFDSWQTNRKANKYDRFQQIWRGLVGLGEKHEITAVAMEALYFSRNVSTALPVSEVRGMVFAFALDRKLPLFEYTPSQIKLAVTGYGHADKHQVSTMVMRLLKLEKIPNLDDTGDALAVGITHLVSMHPTL